MSIKYLRSLEEVWEDNLLPISDLRFETSPIPENSIRHHAILEVLRRIPEKDYIKLKEYAFLFEWFIPDYSESSGIIPFFSTIYPHDKGENCLRSTAWVPVVYLSPSLENEQLGKSVAVVAHELAHIVLKHNLVVKNKEEYINQEESIFCLLCEWGFEKETKKHLDNIKTPIKIMPQQKINIIAVADQVR